MTASTATAGCTIRDCSGPNDQFICRRSEQPGQQSKPIATFQLYIPGKHVQLPFYSQKRWPAIKNALSKMVSAGQALTFTQFKDLYSSYTCPELDFTPLEALIDQCWHEGTLLGQLLPAIAQLALELPAQIRQPICLLLSGQNGSCTLDRRQAAVLLANAFFSTFPARDQSRFNRINFIGLFKRKASRRMEKLKCLLHYFSEFLRTCPSGTLSIIRQKLAEPEPEWPKMDGLLSRLTALPAGRIEDEGATMTQMDFANEFIGGGVLGFGSVQEEIRFLISPELLLSCLLCERMDEDEAVLLVGAERYSNYAGYGQTFRWIHRKKEQQQPARKKDEELLAIDALSYSGLTVQFREKYIRRELLKAYAGFSLRTPTSPVEIATGNWGCGAFGGDLELKSLIQLLAASAAQRRPLFYFTFGSEDFAQELDQTCRLLERKAITIGHLYRMIVAYAGTTDPIRPGALFPWIKEFLERPIATGSGGEEMGRSE